jgi:pyruvate dehydrogenase E2 component (dihydrolipoamide acetyltransferase)
LATPIVMPRLGDFMTEGTVVRLARAQGDQVGRGEVIAEIETEKLNYDLEAVAGGIFHPVVVEGATVAVDGLIAYVLEAGEKAPEAETPQAPAAPTSTRQASARRPATASGGGGAFRSTPGARKVAASLGLDLAQVTPTGPGGRIVEADVRAFADQQSAAPAVVPSTPAARRLATSLGVDLSQVTPTGPAGRIVEADVRAFADQQKPAMPPGLPEPSRSEPLRGMRRSIAQHMSDSLKNSAQLSYFMDVDVTEGQRLRREASQGTDTTITMAHLLIKACAATLRRVPTMNSVLTNGEIHYFDQVNIGVAVALDDGLIVPVLRDVGSMDIHQIADATQTLSERARANDLSPDDVVGGTFTISVLGSVDGFTPILNPPQSGILGVGRSVQKPVVNRGKIVVREMMTLSLTADHQVIDGAVAASFMRRLQATIERPAALLK